MKLIWSPLALQRVAEIAPYIGEERPRTAERWVAAALKLSDRERARLAELLIASLDEQDDVGEAWADEAERRFDELRSGAVQAVPAEEVFARIRSRLR